MLNYPWITLPVAFIPNLLLLLPTWRTCQKRGINPWQWLAVMAVFPMAGLPWMVATYAAPAKRAKMLRMSIIGSLMVCGSFYVAAWFIDHS